MLANFYNVWQKQNKLIFRSQCNRWGGQAVVLQINWVQCAHNIIEIGQLPRNYKCRIVRISSGPHCLLQYTDNHHIKTAANSQTASSASLFAKRAVVDLDARSHLLSKYAAASTFVVGSRSLFRFSICSTTSITCGCSDYSKIRNSSCISVTNVTFQCNSVGNWAISSLFHVP